MNLRLSLTFLSSIISLCLYAEKFIDHSISAYFRPQWVIPTNNFVKNADINSAFGADIKYSFRFSPESFYGRNYPATRQGIGIGYTNILNGKNLGAPVNMYLFQNIPVAKLSSRLSLICEWNFGLSFNWNPYNAETNSENGAIGSKTNAYINLGLLFRYKIGRKVELTAGIDGTHYSNGNTTITNAGINTVGARIGILYTFGSDDANVPIIQKDDFERGFGYDVMVYGATRRRAFTKTGSNEYLYARGQFGVLGMNFAPMYGFNRYFRAGVSLDGQYDESANILNHRVEGTPDDDMKFYRPPFKEQMAIGISVRAELVMPVFSINIGIGRNIVCKGRDTDIFYQMLTLKTYIWRNAFLNIGYQLNAFHEPNNLMLGFGYSFGMKR